MGGENIKKKSIYVLQRYQTVDTSAQLAGRSI